ncbi:peptidoglycan DD-transpeptidase MrdA [Budviciaceae bacterium BWR-B9]|uniref:Peptidoglycan D,D-transpeptidase MrdA n=1 Tax=Limnobaculum allomyrinae TaxID=2791986 RepID=A0ABS1IM58_9GAMM|nr:MULTISPECIES: peptidoglycan DD-transpeptidase MrdA [Limnobaculum]MBK5142837.1 peptidoglycan DD-transpeptidase MrdA [Limnobaculum allomyrinae]MBV7690276.1 peptidoglycan DD-transpeptidase MrdA [Limnobaculum sp. M2-1]
MKKEPNAFRDHTAESALFIRRALVALVGVIILIAILIANLYNIQIKRFEDYQTRSNDNRIKLVPIAPTRGLIYDRNGVVLAENRTIYQLELVPEKISNLKGVMEELRSVVDLDDDDIANFEKERKNSRRFTPIALKTKLTELQISRFAVNQYRFPGIEIKGYQRRFYPYGSALTHVVGYVSKINTQDLERLAANDQLQDYSATHDIGKQGIEKYYEEVLHGKPGYEEVEVNSRGRVIRQLNEQPPQAGKDIYLTIDLNLQKYIEELLGTRRAAVVVSDPRDGGILAMVSSPSYDPNMFVDGIAYSDYQKLLNDPDRPLINRTTQGTYPPASTVKPYVAVAALSEGVITKKTSIYDPGWWQLPNTDKRYRDWKRSGHGHLDVTRALEESADTYFYQVAYDMGIDRLSGWMRKFGYGEYSGIDIAEEYPGVMPTREWKMKRHKKQWYQGDTIPVGIGQGYWTATPMQMSKSLVTLINDGLVKTPHLLSGTKINGKLVPYQQKENIHIGDIKSGFWEIAKDGMYGVVSRPNGTARRVFAGTPYKAAGKSGTAQVFGLKKNEVYNAKKISEHLRDHALFVGFAPYDSPRVAVSMILENGGGGGGNAGPIVRRILDHILLNDQNTAMPELNASHSDGD